MKEKETDARKPLIFLFVLLCHGLLFAALMQASKQVYLRKDSEGAILLFINPRQASSVANASKPENFLTLPRRRISPPRRPTAEPAPNDTFMPPVETVPASPSIDWQHELELAALNGVANTENEMQYRDLSKSMSPAQLTWLTQHHMEPANPGITWKRPRVEVTKDGLPIVHINDHCVLVPMFLIPMVFCSIGHIEPNGDLFNHMHDPQR